MLHHLEKFLSRSLSNEVLHVAHSLTKWRWQTIPWDRQTIAALSTLDKAFGRQSIFEWWQQDARLDEFLPQAVRAMAEGDSELVASLWREAGVKNPARTGETLLYFLQRGDESLAGEVLETLRSHEKSPLYQYGRALSAYCFDPPEKALRELHRLQDDFAWLRDVLTAQCLCRLNDDEAPKILARLWREIPWHPNLTLKLHGLLHPGAQPAPAGAETAILLYSWNNADLLAQTLDSLAASELGAASVLVLDNGSADHTSDVVQAASNRFGQRLTSLRLPVNIGAPAARNWLLRHPETRRFRTVVFLDDDVLLPRDWLTRLATQYRRAPAGSIVGCRIMDQAPRRSVQMADVNLLDIEPDGDFLIANSGGGELDLGLHDYSRPCLSVTGCCHMMDRERAIRLGGFDVRFNPSQFDDFDLDLRNALAGGQAFYAGDTGIMHCQRSSLNQADSEAKRGHIQGNMLKLNTKYTPAQKAELLRINREMLWNDLLAKTRDLESM